MHIQTISEVIFKEFSEFKDIFVFAFWQKTALISAPAAPNPAPIRLAISRKEVHVRHLQIRFVSQGVVCVHRVSLGGCLFVVF
jgi:hypothetical protein